MNVQTSFPAWSVTSILMILSSTYFLYFEEKFLGNILISNLCAFLLLILIFRLRRNSHREIYLIGTSSSKRKKSKQYPLLASLFMIAMVLFISQVPYTLNIDLVWSFMYIFTVVLVFETIIGIIDRRTVSISKTIINGFKKNPAVDKLDWNLLSEGNKHILIFRCPNFTLAHVVRLLRKILHRCNYEVLVKDPVFHQGDDGSQRKVVELVLFKGKCHSVLFLECIDDIPEYTLSL